MTFEEEEEIDEYEEVEWDEETFPEDFEENEDETGFVLLTGEN